MSGATMDGSLARVVRWVLVLVPTLGVVAYAFMFYLGLIEWRQNPYIHESGLAEARFLLLDLLIGSGLPPLAIAIYFFGVSASPRGWAVGLGLLFALLAAHYFGIAFLAHGAFHAATAVLLTETAAALTAIAWWHRRARG